MEGASIRPSASSRYPALDGARVLTWYRAVGARSLHDHVSKGAERLDALVGGFGIEEPGRRLRIKSTKPESVQQGADGASRGAVAADVESEAHHVDRRP